MGDFIQKIRTKTGDKQIDYEALANIPYINNIQLTGSKTLDELGIQKIGEYITEEDANNKYTLKEDGKGLSSNDFSNEYKNKIDEMKGVSVSETQPENDNISVWINPESQEEFNIPEVDDDSINNNDTWSSNKIHNEIQLVASQNRQYIPPDKVDHGTSDTTFALPPNIEHSWGEVAELNITLQDGEENKANIYCFSFISGATPTVLSISPIKTQTTEIEPNGNYTVVIFNGIAAVGRSDL